MVSSVRKTKWVNRNLFLSSSDVKCFSWQSFLALSPLDWKYKKKKLDSVLQHFSYLPYTVLTCSKPNKSVQSCFYTKQISHVSFQSLCQHRKDKLLTHRLRGFNIIQVNTLWAHLCNWDIQWRHPAVTQGVISLSHSQFRHFPQHLKAAQSVSYSERREVSSSACVVPSSNWGKVNGKCADFELFKICDTFSL